MSDKVLMEKIKGVLFEHKILDLTKVKELLDDGANPKVIVFGEKKSAYDLVKDNNETGEFNALIEEFDQHVKNDLREADSVDEGMHLTDDEI